MKAFAFVALLLAANLAGCSGGGSSNMPQSVPVVKVRFVNAAPRMGPVTFSMGGVTFAVPARGASPTFSVVAGPATVTVNNCCQTFTRSLTINNVSEVYVVANEFIAGHLDAISIEGQYTPVDPQNSLLTAFNFMAGLPPLDTYAVRDGASIASVAPNLASNQGGAIFLAPGTYNLVVTPAGEKTVLFRSDALNLAAGQQVEMLTVEQSAYITMPLPLLLGLDSIGTLVDSRPAVKLLNRIDGHELQGPSTISVDGRLVAQFPLAESAAGAVYHLDPGVHAFSQTGPGFSLAFSFPADAGKSYVERYGAASFGAYPGPTLSWLPPQEATDYPIPASVARVRLIVENCCRDNLILVDGNPIAYASQALGNPGVVIDRPAGEIRIEVKTPDGTISEGVQTLALNTGTYTVVRVLPQLDQIPGGTTDPFAPGQGFQRTFEVSQDQSR